MARPEVGKDHFYFKNTSSKTKDNRLYSSSPSHKRLSSYTFTSETIYIYYIDIYITLI